MNPNTKPTKIPLTNKIKKLPGKKLKNVPAIKPSNPKIMVKIITKFQTIFSSFITIIILQKQLNYLVIVVIFHINPNRFCNIFPKP